MAKFTVSIKSYCSLNKFSLFYLIPWQSRELLSILEKSRKTFLHFDLLENFVKHNANLPQHLSEKLISDNLPITDIALRN